MSKIVADAERLKCLATQSGEIMTGIHIFKLDKFDSVNAQIEQQTQARLPIVPSLKFINPFNDSASATTVDWTTGFLMHGDIFK